MENDDFGEKYNKALDSAHQQMRDRLELFHKKYETLDDSEKPQQTWSFIVSHFVEFLAFRVFILQEYSLIVEALNVLSSKDKKQDFDVPASVD